MPTTSRIVPCHRRLTHYVLASFHARRESAPCSSNPISALSPQTFAAIVDLALHAPPSVLSYPAKKEGSRSLCTAPAAAAQCPQHFWPKTARTTSRLPRHLASMALIPSRTFHVVSQVSFAACPNCVADVETMRSTNLLVSTGCLVFHAQQHKWSVVCRPSPNVTRNTRRLHSPQRT